MKRGKSERIRSTVRLRDGDHCCYCERRMNFTTRGNKLSATIEHVQRRADGGTLALGNVKLACRECNSGRGERTYAEWVAIRSKAFGKKRKFRLFVLHFKAKFNHAGYVGSFE